MGLCCFHDDRCPIVLRYNRPTRRQRSFERTSFICPVVDNKFSTTGPYKACSSTAPASPRVSSQPSLSPSVFFLSITLFPGKKQHTESEIGFAGSENGNMLRSFADQWFPRDRRLRVRIGAGNWVINGMLRFSSYKVCVRIVFVMF